MRIEKLVLGIMNTNVYLIFFENEAWVIDPADDAQAIFNTANGYPITNVLLTHGHFDHCNAAYELQKRGAQIFMSKKDYQMIENGYDLAKFCNVDFNTFYPDKFIEEGVLNINGQDIQVISTPGHTAGSLSYIIDNNIFCGDTLFYMSVGRSDLPTGNKRQLIESIKKLYLLTEAPVYPGHGRMTSLSFEKENNPYVKI